jgi:phosphoribosyl-AMP cyclohydrolase
MAIALSTSALDKHRRCSLCSPPLLPPFNPLYLELKPMIDLAFDKHDDGLVPVIAQDYQSRSVLMLAYINRQAWEMTLKTGKAHYWSRSRRKIWLKGESSGHIQRIMDIYVDCDEDTVIYLVEQRGPGACHMGYHSCFYRKVAGDSLEIHEERQFNPDDVY